MANKILKVLNRHPRKSWHIIRGYLAEYINRFPIVSLYKTYVWKREQKKFFGTFLRPDNLVFDIGASSGNKTDIFLELGSTVVAVEPQHSFANFLRDKYRNNKKIIVEECALGKERGLATIHISTKYPGFSSLNPLWQKDTKYDSFDKTAEVQVDTLDGLIRKYGLPDFCKIDVEGYESAVLAGLSRKISSINFEFHSNAIKPAEECLAKLAELGFTEYNFALFEDGAMALGRWVTASDLLNNIKHFEYKHGKIIWGDIYAR